MRDPELTELQPSAPARIASGRELLPGTLVAGRFRIVSLLGRGGMGEVYRAEDLRLRETVALKLLSTSLAEDAGARSRLEQEVRLARRVTHPHVCRVFDVVDIDGSAALCMEYVDGEDLASLLRRVGHLPAERAMKVARQIVLGVSAIHRQGLLHRDLKPGNVMIDSRGGARLMDFGLAAEGPDDLFCGTPAYMAPEQLAGGAASVQSDLFSLALVLHELFSGERAYSDRPTLDELRRDRAASEPRTLDAGSFGLPDRLVEELARCLRRSPAERPRSASELLAALPGGDPIAEALAAGETPSPDAVAGGGPEGHLAPRRATLLLAVAAIGLGVFFALVDRVSVVGHAAPRLSREALEDRAKTLLAGLRTEPARSLHWSGFDQIESVFGERVSPETSQSWAGTGRGPLVYLYAEAQDATDPADVAEQRRVGSRGLTGESSVRLSLAGNLLRLAITSAALPAVAGEPTRWADLFAAAGLPAPTSLEELTAAEFTPPMFADERHVWRARTSDGEEVRVYAAAQAGTPRYFSVRPASSPPPGQQPSSAPVSILDGFVVVQLGTLGLMALGGFLAWRNVRAGRADRRGAARLAALVLFVGGALQAAFMVLAVPAVREQATDFAFSLVQFNVLLAALIALLYLALEPEVRRRRPRAAVAWSRLLRGQLADPLIARELLIGLACGGALAGLWAVEQWIVSRLEVPWFTWEPVFAASMLESPFAVLAGVSGALTIGGVAVFVPLLLWSWLLPILRSPAVTEAVAVAVTTALVVLFTAAGPTAAALVFGATIALLALRVGIVAAVAADLFWPILISGAYTLDGSRFYFSNTLVVLALLGTAGAWAWHAAVRKPAASTTSRGA